MRRRFWEQVLHSCDPSGTAAQMRTQLRVTHEACRLVAERPLGAIIPADFLYDQQANELVISGEMQKRFQEIIEEQKTRPDGALRSRICALVFLINKLPREGADIGVRATPEHLADLLTDDLGSSATDLRAKVPGLVHDLVNDGVLMEIDGEYRLQTTEGAAWESEFRRRRASILNNEPQLAAQRGQLLSKAIQTELAGVNVLHGAAKVKRKVAVHHGMTPPAATDDLTVWVRDGFQESESAVIQDIQQRSVDDATIHVLIPKTKADLLKNALASAVAAEETLNFKGQPSSQEGRDARAAMVSRQAREDAKVRVPDRRDRRRRPALPLRRPGEGPRSPSRRQSRTRPPTCSPGSTPSSTSPTRPTGPPSGRRRRRATPAPSRPSTIRATPTSTRHGGHPHATSAPARRARTSSPTSPAAASAGPRTPSMPPSPCSWSAATSAPVSRASRSSSPTWTSARSARRTSGSSTRSSPPPRSSGSRSCSRPPATSSSPATRRPPRPHSSPS